MSGKGKVNGRVARTGAGRQDRYKGMKGPSPGPWRVAVGVSGLKLRVVDAGGLEVAMCVGEMVPTDVDEANAELLVRAVNEWFERNGAGTAAGLQDGDGGK